MRKNKLLLSVLLCQVGLYAMAQSLSYDIRVNQVGYLPNAVKIAAVADSKADSFKVMTSNLDSVVFRGQFLPPAYYNLSGEDVKLADFTLLQTSGSYVIVVDDLGKSVPFSIDKNAFVNLSKASIKAYYYNRASTPILAQYAGAHAREAGHPDTAVVVLPSAASTNRPAGTKISTPGGWYDAGDYNKYIVSSGGTVATILSAYESFPTFYDTLNTNIPESNNNIPDILDEALWNIKWMMTMQDTDGGVYNKTTEANFSGFEMPSKVTATRYVCAKGTAATLDFAAIMAMTARIYKKYDPQLADSALKQAVKAWQWAKKNPNKAFNNPSASGGYPAVNTGGYGDSDFSDELSWCAAELYITTKDSNYYKQIDQEKAYVLPGWPTVRTYGLLSLLVNKDSLTSIADVDLLKSKLIDLVSGTKNNLFKTPYRIPGDFFYWAGNGAYANWGMLFMQAYRITGNAAYYNAAISTLDYLLGKNATTYCFVTGQGTKSPMHPHHRISSADGVAEPVPGMIVCGADGGDVADCGASKYPSAFSAKSYLDSECSYSTNEIAIGLNASLAFLAGAVQTEYLKTFVDSMPSYFSISTNKIDLPYKKGNDMELAIEGNLEWTLTPSADWITISTTDGKGSGSVLINSQSNNPADSSRKGIVYVYNKNLLIDSIAVTQTGIRKNFKIEAEDYSRMSTVQIETTSDVGGGQNVGYVGKGSWVAYNIEITVEGVYNVTVRHAGYAGNLDVYIDSVFVQNVVYPKTADWQVWDNFSTQLSLTEGKHDVMFKFNSDGINLNWYQFDRLWALQVNSLSNPEFINVYPVPAHKYLNIENNSNAPVNIQLLSMDGKVVKKQTMNGHAKESIDLSGIEKGLYILEACSGSRKITKQVVVE